MKNYNEMAESVFERRDKYNAERRKFMSKLKKSITGVACVCLVALLGVGLLNSNFFTTNDTPNDASNVENYASLEGKKNEDSEQLDDEQTTNNVQSIEDVPADKQGTYNENVDENDLTQGTDTFFGGSYTDANGNFVVVLTIDTPENRTAICKELGVNESSTIFESGTYTFEYLTELQNKISSAMKNKELPFVTSSGVYKTINKIKVCVTTQNEADLEKLLAFDTLGGAIEIIYSENVATEDLLAVE